MPQEKLSQKIEPSRQALLSHRLYARLATIDELRIFMEQHVFAVWDFMSLLKALQVQLTCVTVPWISQGNAQLRRLVNEIVLGEESDVLPSGQAISHFDLYLKAMNEIGADTTKINLFLHLLNGKHPLKSALAEADVVPCVSAFVEHTFSVIGGGRLHEIAACFTFGREDLIHEMFNQLVVRLEAQFPDKVSTLRYYLDRHIELDGDEHGEMGRRMVNLLCEESAAKQEEAERAALSALQSRIKLWDGIAEMISPRL